MVVDSDACIDFFRDVKKAREFFLDNTEPLVVSRVTVLEIILGVKTKQAAKKALRQLDALGVRVVDVSEDISRRAGDFFCIVASIWDWHFGLFRGSNRTYIKRIIDDTKCATLSSS